MQKKIPLKLLPAEAVDDQVIREKILKDTGNPARNLSGYEVLKKSIDARGKTVYINLSVNAYFNEPFVPTSAGSFHFKDVGKATHTVIIVGCGPAGLFAALKLIEAGIKPVILERGKDVKARRRDLANLNKNGIINPESNYCFGEGGAGTYSDGKLYTRSNKRGSIERILGLFVHFGAEDNILYDAHPHIGTNKLPQIITAMRNQIIKCGGEVRFDSKVTDLEIINGKVNSVTSATGNLSADCVILATGHSARDIFQLLQHKKLSLEAKPLAIGVRVEHPQQLIDTIQYHQSPITAHRDAHLPPASYSLVKQVEGRGVFSFCMCPGGIIAPASTSPGELVINGWSPSKRNNPFANSGMVVEVSHEQAFRTMSHVNKNANDPLLFMNFQQMIEQSAYNAGGGSFVAPAQRMTDFCTKRISNSLSKNSYLPGLQSTDLKKCVAIFYVYQPRKSLYFLRKKDERLLHS